MQKTLRRITVTSSFNEISTDQLGKRIVLRGKGFTPSTPNPFYSRLLDRLKDDVNGFSS
jgi:hypothetical protein